MKHSASVEDLQQVIGRAVEDTAAEQAVEINTFHLMDDMLKDVIKLDVAPGGGQPVWSNFEHGVCILNMLPTTTEQIKVDQRIEDNYRETQATRTFVDAQGWNKADPQMPAGTYESLKENAMAYRMYLLTLFGHNYQHYQGVWAIRKIIAFHEKTSHTSQSSVGSSSTVAIFPINA